MELAEALKLVRHGGEKRGMAVRWLGVYRTPEAIAALVEALNGPDHELRGQVARVVMFSGIREAVPALIRRFEGAETEDERLQWCCAVASVPDPRASHMFLAALQHPDPAVVVLATGALGKLREERTHKRLLALLQHPSSQVREAAREALTAMGVDHPLLWLALDRAVREAEADGDYYRAGQLKAERAGGDELSETDYELAIDASIRRIESSDMNAQECALWALGQLGGPRSLARLLEALEDRRPFIRGSAALALGHKPMREALPRLIHGMLHDRSHHVRSLCAASVQRCGDASAVEPLIQALQDPDDKVVYAAATALGHLRDPRAIPALIPELDHPEWRHRRAICLSLVRLGAVDPRLVATLEQLAADPEAEEDDLMTLELNLAEWPVEDGPAEPGLTVRELLARARELAAWGDEATRGGSSHEE
jgi:HEAT repeat protein